MVDPAEPTFDRLKWTLALAFLALLLYGLHTVLRPFFVPIGWAAVLTLAAWPVHGIALRAMPQRPGLVAFAMVILLAVVIVAPAVTVGTALFGEIRDAVRAAEAWFAPEKPELPQWLGDSATLGPWARARLDELKSGELLAVLRDNVAEIAPVAGDAAAFVGKVVVRWVACLFISYFLFRHGAHIALQVRRVAGRIGGQRFERLLRAVKATVKGAIYGTVATALAQSTLAGVGFYVAQAPVPLLLGVATFGLAFVPFGPPLVYLPVAGLLVANGAPVWHGILLAVWGVGVISTVDNIIRPLLISQATQMPLLLVIFGVLGGVAAFGLIGVFLGPAVIAVAHALWNEWAEPDVPPTTAEMRVSGD